MKLFRIGQQSRISAGREEHHANPYFVAGGLRCRNGRRQISIIPLTVPIFAPISMQLGFDPLAFAIIGILAIGTGLLTPPFGLLVFTVKAAVPDPNLQLGEIFRGSIPYWIVLLLVVAALAVFPSLATFLPNL
jgi:TRAP-type C4-dicarboxylate transport system permease large subunit